MRELEENKDGYEHRRRLGVLTADVDAHLVNTVVLVLFVCPQSCRVHFYTDWVENFPRRIVLTS